MSITRQHFRLIADALHHTGTYPTPASPSSDDSRSWHHGFESGYRYARHRIILALADHLAALNPRFDRARFLADCDDCS